MAAVTLFRSDSYLGARFRYLRGRLGPGKAVKAMAAHLARLIYRMLQHGQAWVDRGAAEHQRRRQEREQLALQRKAVTRGYRVVAAKCRSRNSLRRKEPARREAASGARR